MQQLWFQIFVGLILKEIVVLGYQELKAEFDLRQWTKELAQLQVSAKKAKKNKK
jgi:hypothetical protein